MKSRMKRFALLSIAILSLASAGAQLKTEKQTAAQWVEHNQGTLLTCST